MAQANKQTSPVDGWFNTYRVSGSQESTETAKQFYFVESNAPINVDRASDPHELTGKIRLTPSSTSEIFDEIAKTLKESWEKSNLTILVHGFNNPSESLINKLYVEAYQAMHDIKIGQENSVCIAYRWPSENIVAPWKSLLSAAPRTLLAILLLGLGLLFLSLFKDVWTWPAWLLLGFVIGAFTLRIIVYYRDQYRATHYGGPDLVELVRDLDNRLGKQGLKRNNRVRLSFVAHSMGGYVVTNAIRILSDLFTPQAIGARGRLAESGDFGELAKLGNHFTLGQLVLVSPDIPAEVLISNRANVLATSLRRFPEAYLFSNEGDEVLRMVSTIANYFTYPTASHDYGYRLGNASIHPDPAQGGHNSLWVGFKTLKQLEDSLKDQGEQVDFSFQGTLTYFDCTYFKDDNDPTTLTGDLKESDKTLSALRHVLIFIGYLRSKYDVHGGYFYTPFLRNLIFGLANDGFAETDKTYNIKQSCQSKRIKILLSDSRAGKEG